MSRKVLHVLAPAPYGGLERVVHLLAGGQRARGDDVHVAALLDEGAKEPPLVAELRRDGVDVLPLVLPPRAYVSRLAQLRDVCAELRPEVIHSHGYVADVMAALLPRSRGAPLVTTVHGFTGGDWKNRFYEWIQCQAYRRFDAVVAVSNRLAATLRERGVAAERLYAVPNAWSERGTPLAGPSARRAMSVPEEAFSIGWVGRVSREKGLDILIEALPALDGLPWRLTILGDGRERPGLERRAQVLGLASRVSWRGVVPHAGNLMRGFDVVVLSSRTEGTPMNLFEAMDGEVPLIVTAVGGVPEVVSPSEAVIVPPDDPYSLARAIRAVHADPSGATRRAAAARARLRTDFASQPWLERYDRIYQAIQSPAARTAT
jgi:glycosyltransferase involved in cell wall biosynthesis